MAHHFKVDTVPHLNKDGSPSKTKRDHFVRHTGRGGSYRLGPYGSKREAENVITLERGALHLKHLADHPNDKNFRRKHGLN